MRKWIILLVVVAQVALLAFMAGEREWVARTGRTVWLRTMPLDPNDPMRGAYVRLNYEFSRVMRAQCRDGLAEWMDARSRRGTEDWRTTQLLRAELRDRKVYALLREGPHGLAELVALTDREPSGGFFLRGRADASWDGEFLTVRYGTEALFLQQDKAKKLELEAVSRGREDGVVLNAEVAVGASGLAVLKGYRWEPLGILLTTETAPEPALDAGRVPAPGIREPRRQPRPVIAVTVELKNHGARPLAIATRADGGFLRLVPNEGWGDSRCRWVGAELSRPTPTAEDIRILKPGESHRVRLDLAAPEWAVLFANDKTSVERSMAIPALAEEDGQRWSFRIEYVPPTAEECAGLPGTTELWLKELRSRAFFPRGGAVD